MDKDTVLVLTQRVDFTADFVIRVLNARGVNLLRVDTSEFPIELAAGAIHDGSGWKGTLTLGPRQLDLARVCSVWYRRPTAFVLPTELTEVERSFALGEARMGLGGLLRSLDAPWVNHPERQATCNFKIYQLKVATEVGLETPRTLLTNRPEDLRAFYDECDGNIICKPLSNPQLRSPDGMHVLYTNRVSSADLEDAHRVRSTANLFQAYVPKAFELRVTIIGDEIYCAELHSQHSDAAKIDWRMGQSELRYAEHELPDYVLESLRLLMRELGLVYGAIDLIVTPDGRYVFLEINPGGQFGWLANELGFPLYESMASCLQPGGYAELHASRAEVARL